VGHLAAEEGVKPVKLGSLVVGAVCSALLISSSALFGATVSPALLKAKQEAEGRGYFFEASHDEIVAKSRKESKLRVLSSLSPEVFPHLTRVFKEKYPFVDLQLREITGTEAAQRHLHDLGAGGAKNWDVSHLSWDFFHEYLPHAAKIDILGMAQQGILAIPSKMIDPGTRSLVAAGSAADSIAYNRCILEPSKVPNRWEDFYKPEFKGKKFIADVQPHIYAAMAAGAGEEWMMSHARKIAAQQPIWTRGHTRVLTAIAAGEYTLHSGTNYHSVVRAAQKDRSGCLQPKVIEPVPMRLQEPEMVVNGAPNVYSGLLWLEFLATPAAQKILDDYEPLKSSIYVTDSALEKLVRGKQIWLADWKSYPQSPRWMGMAVEAFGFPKVDK
jgi:Bacterial extracellular solute-binding protein